MIHNCYKMLHSELFGLPRKNDLWCTWKIGVATIKMRPHSKLLIWMRKKNVCEQWNFFGTYVKAVRFTHDTRSFLQFYLQKRIVCTPFSRIFWEKNSIQFHKYIVYAQYTTLSALFFCVHAFMLSKKQIPNFPFVTAANIVLIFICN